MYCVIGGVGHLRSLEPRQLHCLARNYVMCFYPNELFDFALI